MTIYRVFKRRPWRRNESGEWEVYGGAPKTTVDRVTIIGIAKEMCDTGNAGKEKKPGQIWYEFEAE